MCYGESNMSIDTDIFTDFSIGDLTSELQVEFFKYWHSKRGMRKLSARKDIDPADIIKILPFITLLERFDSDYLFRLVGTRCASLFGEKTGQYVSDTDMDARCLMGLNWCAENFKPYFQVQNLGIINNHFPNSSALVMPLSDNEQDVNMIILAHDFY